MRYLCKRLLARWSQFRIETAMLAAGLRGLIVNLAYLGRLRPQESSRIVVLVDSPREAVLLRLLCLMAVIPQCAVHVIHRHSDLDAHASTIPAEGTLLVATARLHLKMYQQMAGLRQRLLVF